jgi:tetratricopeptide (TPR) repeat protein
LTPAPQIIEQARRQWLADDHEAALDSFRQAMSVQPDDLRLAVEVGSYLGMRFEIDEAVAILTRCEQALSGNPDGLFQVGLAYERAFQPHDALRCFRRVLGSAPNHIAGRVKIAEWHERRNQ